MQVNDKVIVVTGGGGGIGRALAQRFLDEGARTVVAADVDARAAQQTADVTGCEAISVDVSDASQMQNLIEETEDRLGPIDLFCSNAGVLSGQSEQTPDTQWELSWGVNVMAHVYAARYLVPRMGSRGGGYFLNTASAAGLLNQVGGAAYGVTKHAAVGFAEWLALTYRHQGIMVSVLCPQAVRTPMIEGAGAADAQAAAIDGMIEPDHVAECVIEGLAQESFLILPHPKVLTYMQRKVSDYDRWISGMSRLHCSLSGISVQAEG